MKEPTLELVMRATAKGSGKLLDDMLKKTPQHVSTGRIYYWLGLHPKCGIVSLASV